MAKTTTTLARTTDHQLFRKGTSSFDPSTLPTRAELDARMATQKTNLHDPDQVLNLLTIPKRYRDMSFGALSITNQEVARAINIAKRYIENFPTVLERGSSGFFAGGVGTGKTLLSCMIAEAVIRRGHKARYTTAWGMIQDIRMAYRDKTTTVVAMVKKYVTLELLVIDEIGVQHGTEDERVLLYQVIDGRYNNVKPTIIISNSKNPVEDGYLDLRTIDRLNEGGGFSVTFSGESFRR